MSKPDHPSDVVGRASRALRSLAEELRQSGLMSQAAMCNIIADDLARAAYDMLTATQPIEIKSSTPDKTPFVKRFTRKK